MAESSFEFMMGRSLPHLHPSTFIDWGSRGRLRIDGVADVYLTPLLLTDNRHVSDLPSHGTAGWGLYIQPASSCQGTGWTHHAFVSPPPCPPQSSWKRSGVSVSWPLWSTRKGLRKESPGAGAAPWDLNVSLLLGSQRTTEMEELSRRKREEWILVKSLGETCCTTGKRH
ncbi:unnamed protein product [Lepidochelys kempii]